MEKFIPYEKLSKKGSDTTAAGGGFREWSEWQRSARCGVRIAGRRLCRAPQQGSAQDRPGQAANLGELNPVTGQPENSKAYNRNKARNWKRDDHETIPGVFMPVFT